MQTVYAHEDIKLSDMVTVKRGEAVLEIPNGWTLETFIQHATLGQLADHKPKALKATAGTTQAAAGKTGAAKAAETKSPEVPTPSDPPPTK